MEALTAGEPFYLGPADSGTVAIHLSTNAHGIARIYGTSFFECQERAAQIVSAVNSHDALVEALEAFVRAARDPGQAESYFVRCGETIAQARAVLEDVRKGE